MIKVFISYAWESEEHKQSVESLASRLRQEGGVEANIDQWILKPGDQLPQFMEQQISQSDFVLMICSKKYKEKVDAREGGSGYEGNLIAAEIFTKGNQRKFLPVIFGGNPTEIIPDFLSGKLWSDLSAEHGFWDLVATLRNVEVDVPIVIEKSDDDIKKQISINKKKSLVPKQSKKTNENISIIGIIADEVTIPKNDGTRGSALYKIPFKLNHSPSSAWIKLFIQNWDFPPRFTSMHRSGIASVYGNKIYLDGTTIEEVQKYHRDTLVLVIETTNTQYNQLIEREIKLKEQKEALKKEHEEKVQSIASSIKF